MIVNQSVSLLILLFFCVSVTTAENADYILTLNIEEIDGEIRPLLGIDSGPAPFGDPQNPDLTDKYHEIGVRSIRTHGINGAMSMSIIYPDPACDPNDPACYNFTASDAAYKAIVDGGFTPYFRLGDGYEAVNPPRPADQDRWVQAAVNVIKHYREGLWNGFISNISYIEIWNEPDNDHFWPKPHSDEEFFLLFEKSSRALKSSFPDIFVGGPGFTPAGAKTENGKNYVKSFLAYMRDKAVPLDFLSWHMYSNDPKDYSDAAQMYRYLLDGSGFYATENHITEYNTETTRGKKGGEILALRAGSPGAAIMTAAWIELQDTGVDSAYYFRGNDPTISFPEFYGIFYADGEPKKSALAFSLWSYMAGYTKKIPVEGTGSGVYALAGSDESGKVGILLANTNRRPVSLEIVGSVIDTPSKAWLVSDASDNLQVLSYESGTCIIPGSSVGFIAG